MPNHILIDLCNVVYETTCPKYKGHHSVKNLVNSGEIGITEAVDAFIKKLLETRCNKFILRLVLDSRPMKRAEMKDKHITIYDHGRSVDVIISGDADSCIVSLFSRENSERPYTKGDTVFVVTDDAKLRNRIAKATAKLSKNSRPKIFAVDVPNRKSSNKIVPMVIDIKSVAENGLCYLQPFSEQKDLS